VERPINWGLALRKLDKYILKEMVGPFVFGVGAFIIVLVSIDLLYDALRLIVREGYPVGLVARAFVYRMPQTITLTLPMATMLAVPVLAGGLLISALGLVLNEVVVPPANNASNQLLAKLAQEAVTEQGYLLVQLPEDQPPQIQLYAAHFDPQTNRLRDVWIVKFRDGKYWDQYTAESAVWRDTTIEMKNVRHWDYEHYRQERVEEFDMEVGTAPWQLKGLRKKPIDMTLAELSRDIQRMRKLPAAAQNKLAELVEYYHIRLTIPWSALGFALIAAPLALRPKRTTTGVGLGISLAIILAYYIIFNTLRVVGEQGALPPALAAWLPNMILYGVGLGLLIDASR